MSRKTDTPVARISNAGRLASATVTLGLALGLTLAWAPVASAEIRFEERGKRFSLDVRNEPIADVMDELSERFEFTVDGYPEHWSDDPMSFSATGDLERVLRSLLKDTSHVFEYHTDLETNVTRIAALKLLNEGVEGFMANSPNRTASASSSTSGSSRPQSGSPARNSAGGYKIPQVGNGQQQLDRDLAVDGSTQGPSNPGIAANQPRASGLSQTLEARARQASGSTGASSSAPTASASSTTPGAPSAEMQALTRQALKDVQGLAEALRKAEGKN